MCSVTCYRYYMLQVYSRYKSSKCAGPEPVTSGLLLCGPGVHPGAALQHQAQFVNGTVTLPQSQSDMMSPEQVHAHQFPPQQSQAHVQALQLQHQLIRNRLTSMHSSQQEQQ